VSAIHQRTAEPNRHDVLKASLLIGEASEELANTELGAGRGAFSSCHLNGRTPKVDQGILWRHELSSAGFDRKSTVREKGD
jgi:hypothetical protein